MKEEHIKSVLTIFLIAMIARIIFHFLVYEPFAEKYRWNHYPGQFRWYKSDRYDEIALNLISGNGYTSREGNIEFKPNVKRPPVYPLILALQFYLFGDGFWINLLINITYQSLVCVILYYLTLMMFNEKKIAIFSSLIWALYPLPMLHAMGPNTEAIYSLFLVSFGYFFYKFYKFKKMQYLIYSSILMVILTLTRPISLLFPLYFLIITLFIKGFSSRDKIKHVAILFLIFIIGISPWMYRAYKITGKIIPIVTFEATTYFEKKGITAVTRHGGYLTKVKEEIKNPWYFLKNYFIRLARFWYYGHSAMVNAVNALLQVPLLLLSILGIWWARKWRHLIFPLMLTLCYFWFAYGATHAISRYSFPMIVLLCPFAAIGIIIFLHKIFKINQVYPIKFKEV